MTDTHALVSAVGMGKGLKANVSLNVATGPTNMMVPPLRASAPMTSVSPSGVGQINKAPSGIKTNIKPAMQVHQFSR